MVGEIIVKNIYEIEYSVFSSSRFQFGSLGCHRRQRFKYYVYLN